MKEEQKHTPTEFKFVEPQLIKAGSDKIMLGAINPQYPKVDCRVIWEDNYQYLMGFRENYHTLKQQNEELIGLLKERLETLKDWINEILPYETDLEAISEIEKIENLLTKHKL